MPKIGLMISATDANDVWHDYIDAFENAIQTPGVNYDPKPLHGAGGRLQHLQSCSPTTYTRPSRRNSYCRQSRRKGMQRRCLSPPPDPPIPNPPAIVVASAGDLTGLADQNLTGCTNGQQKHANFASAY